METGVIHCRLGVWTAPDTFRGTREPSKLLLKTSASHPLPTTTWLCSTPWWLWIDIGWRHWRKSCWLHGHATTRTCYCWSGAVLLKALGEERENTLGLPLPLLENSWC